ncbi:MAG: alpha/beta fold hydrolase [Nitriliruptorales bacterium]|nr:alpha/beta fold hydrolase [Nitriliruptorales bacterium]
MTSSTVTANGIEIAYETFGDPTKPPILLIMGLGVPLLGWEEDLCHQLACSGHLVIRFDNRDVGLSTHLHDAGASDPLAVASGDTATAAYLIDDMADDTSGLIEALGLEAAHLVGVSMGGMIAQAATIRHPARVRSLTSIMSTTGDRSVGQPTQEALVVLMQPLAVTREEGAERAVESFRVLGSPGFPPDEESVRSRALRSFDRAYDPAGVSRQLAAILASADRTPGLREVRAPALVIHGDSDPLIDVSGGRATAAAIPGAELEIIEGMGHDLPRGAWNRMIDRISEIIQRGELIEG